MSAAVTSSAGELSSLPAPDQLQLFTLDQLAARLQLSKRTLRDLIVRGLFPPADVRIGAKIRRWSVEEAMRGVEGMKKARRAPGEKGTAGVTSGDK